jgi:hypothetical protein
MTVEPQRLESALREAIDAEVLGREITGLAVSLAANDTLSLWTPTSLDANRASLPIALRRLRSPYSHFMLQEENPLDLDATIDAWFPNIADASRITLRQLLSHRAGIRDYRGWGVVRKIDLGAERI